MKKISFLKIIPVLMIIMMIFTACSGGGAIDNTSAAAAASLSTPKDDSDSVNWDNTGNIQLGDTITFTGNGISVDGSKVKITAGGDYTISGTLKDGMISVDTNEKVMLRLNGANITNSNGPAILIVNAKKAYVTLVDGTTNTLTDGSKYSVEAKAALFSNDTLIIKGDGTLNITGNYQHGIASDDSILIANGTINVSKAVKNAVHANNNITVDGGSITVECTSDGFDSEGDIIVNNGTFNIATGDDGIHADAELTINGGKIGITKSYEGLESKTTLTVNGGNIRINASDDALNASADIVINNGTIYADCSGDGFDSNGSMTINGGTSIINSGNNANGPLDINDNGGTFTINGGTVYAAGGPMGISQSEDSKQYGIWINGQINANQIINISDGNGNEIATFAPNKSESLIFYSSDKIKAGATCNISSGGSYSGTAVDGVYSSGAYTAGTSLGTVTMSSKSASVGQPTGMGGGMGGPGGGMRGPDGATGGPNGGMGGPNGSMGGPAGGNGPLGGNDSRG